jgi:hypothetical protein
MTPYRFMTAAFVLAVLSVYPGGPRSYAAPGPAPAAFGQEPWEMPPREFNEIERRGFHDGVEGARRDFGNHRNPDVNNREEYRDPDNIPREAREVYRAAFRRGYEMAASHLWGAPAQPPPPSEDWDRWGMRGLQSDAERRGYREGIEEARRDVQFNRNTDPDDQPEYRNPPVPPPLADEYREGFMRGYEVALSQLREGTSWENRGPDMDRWDPPDRFTDMQRRGFHDGVEGARRDFGNHRRPNVANREEYREPRVDREYWHEYRQGFRRGYEVAASRLWGEM